MSEPLSFTDADDALWKQYDELATRSYGHRVSDITDLREHAQLQVALRGDQVVAGGVGLLVEEYFGGRPVPAHAWVPVASPRKNAAGSSPPAWSSSGCARCASRAR